MKPLIPALLVVCALGGAGAFAVQQRNVAARLKVSQDSARAIADSLKRADSLRRVSTRRDSARKAEDDQHALEAANDKSIREMMAPRITRIADSTFAIPAAKYTDIPFARDDSLRDCTVSGTLRGISGGNHDFEAVVYDDDQFENWTHKVANVKSWWSSGRVAAATLALRVPHVGRYHVVVSNIFSGITEKAVAVKAEMTCVVPSR